MLDIIKSSNEISSLFNKGRRLGTPNLTLIVLRNEKLHDLHGRVAFIAGKRLGNAVWRNRAKRRMRGLCKDLGGPFSGYDVLFIARKNTGDVSYSKMLADTKRVLEKYFNENHGEC